MITAVLSLTPNITLANPDPDAVSIMPVDGVYYGDGYPEWIKESYVLITPLNGTVSFDIEIHNDNIKPSPDDFLLEIWINDPSYTSYVSDITVDGNSTSGWYIGKHQGIDGAYRNYTLGSIGAHSIETLNITAVFSGDVPLDLQIHFDAHNHHWHTKQSHDATVVQTEPVPYFPAQIKIDQPDFVEPASQFTINITVDPQGNNISAVQYDLYYNTSVVRAQWANPGPFLKQGGASTDVVVLAIDNNWNVTGHIGKISYAETILENGGTLISVNTSGVLTTIYFLAIGEGGEYSYMNFNDVVMSDPDKDPVDCIINNSGVAIYDIPVASEIKIEQPEFVDPQSQFTINIIVDPQANDIAAVQYDLYYNTSVVRAEWANPGPFLKQGGASTDVVVLTVDNNWNVTDHMGKISYAETILGSGGTLPSVNTSGVLTTIHFSAIGERGTYSSMNFSDVIMSDPDKGPVNCSINDCGVTIYDNIPPVANGSSMHRISNVASKFQCFATLCPCLSYGGGDTWKGNNITDVRWDFGDGQYGTSEGVNPCEVKMHKYTTWNWNGTGYDPFTANLTARDDGVPQLSNSTEVYVQVYIADDTNGDGVVDIFDAACVGKHWGQEANNNPPRNCTKYWTDDQADEADLNNDNDVDTIDAMIVGTNWNHLAYAPYYKE